MDLIFWVTILVIVIAVACDVTSSRIPNWLTFPAMAFAIVCHASMSGVPGLLSSTGGLLMGFFIFVFFYASGGMGAGDVKLMAAIGALLGPRDVLFAAVFTAIAGGIYAIMLLAFRKDNRKALVRCGIMVKSFLWTGRFVRIPAMENEKTTPLKYGVAIGVGTFAVLVQRMIVEPNLFH